MFLPIGKPSRFFFFSSLILLQLLALYFPSRTQALAELSCFFQVKQDNQTVSKIVYNRAWTLEYEFKSTSTIFKLELIAGSNAIDTGNHEKRINIPQLGKGSINSTDILDKEPKVGDFISFNAAIDDQQTPACTKTDFDFTDKVETAVATISSDSGGGNVIVAARGFTPNTQTIQVRFTGYMLNSIDLYDSPVKISSDPWFDQRPWPKESAYTIAELYLCDTNGKNCQQVSGGTLSRGAAGACPTFITFNPPSPSVKDVVQIHWKPVEGFTPDQFVVKIDKKDGDFQLVSAYGRWIADIGTFPTGGLYNVRIVRKADNVNCGNQDLLFVGTFNPHDTSEFDSSCTDDKGKTKTTFGCIARNPTALVNALLPIALGAGGGLAFLLIIYGGFRLATSQGDPKAVQDAREIITGAIIGLLIMILSVFILRLVGIDILGLPIWGYFELA